MVATAERDGLTLLTYPGNVQALQTLIVARYNGVHVAVPPFQMGADNKTQALIAKSPLGKVPALETAEGSISEPAAIARYVARMRADTKMYGASFFEAGLVDQWVEFAKSELDLPVGMWTFPVIGFVASNTATTERARQDLGRALGALQSHLASTTYLVGQTITLADIGDELVSQTSTSVEKVDASIYLPIFIGGVFIFAAGVIGAYIAVVRSEGDAYSARARA